MTFALSSFIVSFVLIVVLIGHKLYEMSRSETAFSKIRGKMDTMVSENISVVKSHSHMFEKGTVRKFFKIFFSGVAEAALHIRQSLIRKWNGFFHSLKTGAVKKSDGEVSIFLKDISRDKKTGGGEKKM
ncbi:MAG: hypothetical protein PHS53_00455 [Candidatus Pacebacteria bacterium]|nr:hypothetical protein [Candidatus Paceibacterota bacterium]MDD5356608.1 hypothetical protein [Candidatus Paceibacterota bacterium]